MRSRVVPPTTPAVSLSLRTRLGLLLARVRGALLAAFTQRRHPRSASGLEPADSTAADRRPRMARSGASSVLRGGCGKNPCMQAPYSGVVELKNVRDRDRPP